MMDALQLKRTAQKCTFGCPILDNAFNGGIPCGNVTELVGESTSAKTQICLQLSLTVQLPVAKGGLDGSALYIFTDNYFCFRRLEQLAQSSISGSSNAACGSSEVARKALRRKLIQEMCPNRGSGEDFSGNDALRGELIQDLCPNRGSGERLSSNDSLREKLIQEMYPNKGFREGFASNGLQYPEDPCQNVFIQGVQTADELIDYLDHIVPFLNSPSRKRVRIIIIDSIAALFRSDFANNATDMKKRSELFFKIASQLRKHAEKLNLAVVVTNQVTDFFESSMTTSSTSSSMSTMSFVSSGRKVIPALGPAWSNCVNTRLFLTRTDHEDDSPKRSIHVVFAPHLPNNSQDFVVTARGVRGFVPRRRVVYREDSTIGEGDLIESSI